MKFLICTLAILGTFSLHANTLKCVGTEPFWGAEINLENGLISISDAGNEAGVSESTEIKVALGTTAEYAFLAQGENISLAVMFNQTCSDGMSEETYTHSVMVTGYTSAPLIGCCK